MTRARKPPAPAELAALARAHAAAKADQVAAAVLRTWRHALLPPYADELATSERYLRRLRRGRHLALAFLQGRRRRAVENSSLWGTPAAFAFAVKQQVITAAVELLVFPCRAHTDRWQHMEKCFRLWLAHGGLTRRTAERRIRDGQVQA
jgi:hypothetical protein